VTVCFDLPKGRAYWSSSGSVRHRQDAANSGGCDPPATTAGRFCPTGAIRALPMEQKRVARMAWRKLYRPSKGVSDLAKEPKVKQRCKGSVKQRCRPHPTCPGSGADLNRPQTVTMRVVPALSRRHPHGPVRADFPHTVLPVMATLNRGRMAALRSQDNGSQRTQPASHLPSITRTAPFPTPGSGGFRSPVFYRYYEAATTT